MYIHKQKIVQSTVIYIIKITNEIIIILNVTASFMTLLHFPEYRVAIILHIRNCVAVRRDPFILVTPYFFRRGDVAAFNI